MAPLSDHRPHVFMEAPVDDAPHHEAQVAGLLLTDLLVAYPDVDLPTIRVWRHSADGVPTIRIDGRRGELPRPECPQCHQPIGREHTDYCTLAPGKVWDGVLPDTTCRCSGLLGRTVPGPQHSAGCPMRIVADR